MRGSVSHSLVKALRAVPDFAPLDDDVLLQVVGASTNLFWSAGSLVFDKGAPAQALYLVLSGGVRVVDVGDGGEEEVARVGVGDYVGEHSLLRDATHTKRVEAVEDSELMVIPKEYFEALLSDNPELAGHFQRTLEARGLDPGVAEP